MIIKHAKPHFIVRFCVYKTCVWFKMADMSFYDKVYDVVKQIPRGKVATYGQIALLCASPRASRAVGYALHFNPDPEHIPCYRVVNRFGRCAPAFAFGGPAVQASLLRADGIEVSPDCYVDLNKYAWTPDKQI